VKLYLLVLFLLIRISVLIGNVVYIYSVRNIVRDNFTGKESLLQDHFHSFHQKGYTSIP